MRASEIRKEVDMDMRKKIDNPMGKKFAGKNCVGRKPRIYVCCPVRPKAKDPEAAVRELKENLNRAERACRLIIEAGGIPLCSPLYCIYGLNLDEQKPEDRRLGLEIGLDMLRASDEVAVFSEHISEGMAEEIKLASKIGIPVRMVAESESIFSKLM